MWRFLFNILVLLLCYSASAEGTKELRPTESDWGNVEINDEGRPFALESNTDSLHRLYIHIAKTTETVYFGFNPDNKTLGNGTFRIKDPSGNVVYKRTNVPIKKGNGFIENYAQACAGPNIDGTNSNGYTPLSFSPTTTGDYYIEFTTKLLDTYHFNLFDITVVNKNNKPIKGRLWSYAWDLSCRGTKNSMQTIFYVYTADKYITAVDMNGIQPYGFVISCNSTGTNKTGNAEKDRQSVSGNHTYPEYKIFLNIPDPKVYDVANIPSMVEDLNVVGSPKAENEVLFFLNMDKAGSLEIFLDLDNEKGYQAEGKDVLLVKYIKAGGDTIIWNGKDGFGNWVQDEVIVGVESRFATGVTHLPLYDPEYHPDGFIVNRILPETGRADLYWDDSQLPDGTTEFLGANGDNNGHNFPEKDGGYGNLKSINTWWNGYENNNLKSFSFSLKNVGLPITLSDWQIEDNGIYVLCWWITASEKNNHYFNVERSKDGVNWEVITTTFGAGNSSTNIEYSEFDEEPLEGTSYYRLKQVDYNESFTYSKIIPLIKTQENHIKFYNNNALKTIILEDVIIDLEDIRIVNTNGQKINDLLRITKQHINLVEYSTENIPAGSYAIYYKEKSYLFNKW